jgi:heme/copper-type cytochrome/quinol oxidase subunit 2
VNTAQVGQDEDHPFVVVTPKLQPQPQPQLQLQLQFQPQQGENSVLALLVYHSHLCFFILCFVFLILCAFFVNFREDHHGHRNA